MLKKHKTTENFLYSSFINYVEKNRELTENEGLHKS